MSTKLHSSRMLTPLVCAAAAVVSFIGPAAHASTFSATPVQAKSIQVKLSADSIRPVKIAAAPATDSNGYAWISYFRSLAGLSPVTRNPKLEAQDAVHVRYLANSALPCETDVHDELLRAANGCGPNPKATVVGKAAANNSDITRVSVKVSDRQAVSNWFGAAFHALTLLDPRLQSTGYAAYYTAHPTGAKPSAWPFTAAADVYRGRTGSYHGGVVAFPANGSATPLLSYQVGTESPEPLRDSKPSACPGWGSKTTVSSPIIVQWPRASGISGGAATIIDLSTGARQPTCALTAASFGAGSLPASFLNGANGITKSGFYYGGNPFTPAHRYQLQIGGRVITTFTAAPISGVQKLVVRPAGQHPALKGAVNLAYDGTGSIKRLGQVWSGPDCTGAIVQQAWTSASGLAVRNLQSHRLYSARFTAVGSGGAARWSGCVNFRPV